MASLVESENVRTKGRLHDNSNKVQRDYGDLSTERLSLGPCCSDERQS